MFLIQNNNSTKFCSTQSGSGSGSGVSIDAAKVKIRELAGQLERDDHLDSTGTGRLQRGRVSETLTELVYSSSGYGSSGVNMKSINAWLSECVLPNLTDSCDLGGTS